MDRDWKEDRKEGVKYEGKGGALNAFAALEDGDERYLTVQSIVLSMPRCHQLLLAYLLALFNTGAYRLSFGCCPGIAHAQ